MAEEKRALELEIEHSKNLLKRESARHTDAMEAQARETRQAWEPAERQRESKVYHRGRHEYYKWALELEERARADLIEERLRYPIQCHEREELFYGGPVRPAKRDNRFASPYAAARNVARRPQADARPTYQSIDMLIQAHHYKYGGFRC